MGVRGYTDLLSNLYTLEQLVKQIHAFHFLLKVCTSVNIQRERNIFVSENFRKMILSIILDTILKKLKAEPE